MKTKTLIFIMSTLILGCSTDNVSTQQKINLNNEVDLVLKNSANEDLLNPITNGNFSFENIKLYFDVNGEKQEVYDKNLDFPRNLRLVEGSQGNVLVIYTNSLSNKLISELNGTKIVENITYLELSANSTDTIKTYSQMNSGNFSITKVWYNNKLVWENDNPKLIEIIK